MDTIDDILARIQEADIPGKAATLFGRIASAAKTLGRATARQLLYLYYTLKDGDLSGKEKAWVYAAIAYIIIPGDLLPRKAFHLLGLTDDAAALAFVIKKVRDRITPQTLQKTEMQLDEWFGCRVS